jgi:1,3-beta-glucanosyltransferase GAS1
MVSLPSHTICILPLTLHRCGYATYETSGYIFLQQNASEYNIPIFFSETGCNVGTARTFDDQTAIFGDKMVDTWSGAIIYEWIQETNDYGLVEYSLGQSSPAVIDGADATFGRNGTPQPKSPDFENLSKHWATLTPTGVRADDYKPSLSAPVCPDFTTSAWQVKADAQLPTIGYGSKAASSSTESEVPTSIATATGQAIPGDGEPVHETAHATEATSSATSSAAASGMLSVMPGFKSSSGTWLGLYVTLCATAGVFLVL